MEPREKDNAVIPRCYECGRPVFSKRELMYCCVALGQATLWGVRLEKDTIRRRPFHRECWQTRRHRELVAWMVALGILSALILGPALVNLLR